MENSSAEKQLITAIFRQAVVDVLNCPRASTDPSMRYSRTSNAFNSASAKRFLDKANPDFQYYCGLLGYLPEYAEKKLWDYIRKETSFPTLSRKLKYELQGV